MIENLKKIFGLGPSVDFAKLVKEGATVIDVRSRQEYADGHLQGSINIPLPNLVAGVGKINKAKPVITVCASGMRSASAKNILKSNGFTEVYNGGGWEALKNKVKK